MAAYLNKVVSMENLCWESHCCGLFNLPRGVAELLKSMEGLGLGGAVGDLFVDAIH